MPGSGSGSGSGSGVGVDVGGGVGVGAVVEIRRRLVATPRWRGGVVAIKSRGKEGTKVEAGGNILVRVSIFAMSRD